MIQNGTLVKIVDKTGTVLGQCIKVLRSSHKKKIAKIGDMVLIVIKRINPRKFVYVKEVKKKRFAVGTLHKAIVLRDMSIYRRAPGAFFQFRENAVIIVSRRGTPVTKRFTGPIL